MILCFCFWNSQYKYDMVGDVIFNVKEFFMEESRVCFL